jgi:hypothetical protein
MNTLILTIQAVGVLVALVVLSSFLVCLSVCLSACVYVCVVRVRGYRCKVAHSVQVASGFATSFFSMSIALPGIVADVLSFSLSLLSFDYTTATSERTFTHCASASRGS